MEPIWCDPEREKAFQTVQGSLASAPALGFPDYSRPFELFMPENKGRASRALTQKSGSHRCPGACYTTQLDPAVAGNNGCVKARAATATAMGRSRPLVLGHPTAVYVLHEAEVILKQHAT